MEARIRPLDVIAGARRVAEAAGSYAAGPDPVLFDRQDELVTPSLLDAIAGAQEGRFRFPGMFGAVAPLFDQVA